MQAILAWMRKDPKAARELMWENKSFVFFRELELPEPELGAPGAQMVQLTPLRSLAVDRSLWAFGTPVWVDSYVPDEKGGKGPAFRRSDDRAGYRHGDQGRGARRCLLGLGCKGGAHGRSHEERGQHGCAVAQGSGAQASCPAMSRKPYQAPDHDLWVEVARTLKPLGKRVRKEADATKPAIKASPKVLAPSEPRPLVAIPRSERSGPPQISAFDRRTSQRLMRGQAEIDAQARSAWNRH